jgi:hypothetical protein
MKQTTKTVFMIRPASFGYNAETAASNAFQTEVEISELHEKVWAEFDEMVAQLSMTGIDVFVFEDTAQPQKPDAIFPNNWVSLHADGTAVLYPMLAPNRRLERRTDVLEQLRKHFSLLRILDLTAAENREQFLEGTGSIVFDHQNKTAFACRSPRTNENLTQEVCAELGYTPLCFDAFNARGKAIYHTNVLLAIGTGWAVCCAEAISETQRNLVLRTVAKGGRNLVSISQEQMSAFAGNMLGLQSATGEELILVSQTAMNALSAVQKESLVGCGKLLPIAIPTIEKIGGGSVRCMVAEIFLPTFFGSGAYA